MGPDKESTWCLWKLDSGLFVLQTMDYILDWLCMDNDGVSISLIMIVGSYKQHPDP